MSVKKRGPKHKTQLDREATLEKVARYERMGYSTRRIGELLGFSHVQISLYEKELANRYKATQLDEREAMVEEATQRYREIKSEAREAWDRSQRSEDPEERAAGNAAFLEVMLKCEKAEREMRGLDAPTKSDVRAAVAQVEVRPGGLPALPNGEVDWDALAGRPAVPDPVEEAKARALPAHDETAPKNKEKR